MESSVVEGNEKQCPFCAESIKAEAIRCKHCQADVSVSPNASDTPVPEKTLGFFPKLLIVVVGGFAGLMVIGFFSSESPEGRAKSHARAAIELCRKEEANYTGPVGAKQIISGACMKLENDFKTRFGFAP